LGDIEQLKQTADGLGRQIFDVRHPYGELPIGDGAERTGKRLLPVGTDCSCGKMYTALAIEKELRARGVNADFRATGQTGILIGAAGMSVDAVPADFVSGVVEAMSPANDEDHWDIIEGQGSLYHPSFAGVSLALLHGAQPDALVLCHEPTRKHMRGLSEYPIPDLRECMELNLQHTKLTNKNAKFVGLSINTANLDEESARVYLARLEEEFALPATDPYRFGVAKLVDALD
ncbi:MAG: NAD-dependent epimerase/dehydratase family protein, partial [Parvularculaceae bacterium]|nr:NAD-dependent epimerase/dehydratase family protein [Parvularculaceae bacterium]